MKGERCTECGETRWSLLLPSRDKEPSDCPVCGSTMVPERRTPGRKRTAPRRAAGAAAAPERRRALPV